jgi:anthranilate synthase/aminodeoxychorismate synthase-like glutamine amidotransferase
VGVTRILVIDSYDSFVYNIVQYLGEIGVDPVVVRNDAIGVDEVVGLAPDGILLSPGPGRPEDAGIICDVVRTHAGRIPLFGVCLGHQAIGHVFGGRVVRAPALMHGKTSSILHEGEGVFAGLPTPIEATRYHSLVVDAATLPAELRVTARTADGLIMGLRHRDLEVEGVQFHPESILTASGREMLRTFADRCGPVPAR